VALEVEQRSGLDEQAVASGLSDAALMNGERCRADASSALRVCRLHQPRVASDIGCENGCKPAFDPRVGHLMRSGPG